MDYLFGIVVLLCAVVQAGRGAKPKHNVPRLKLSYKGKPPRPDSGIHGAALVLSQQPVQPVSPLRLLLYALLFMPSFLFGVSFFPLFYFGDSIPSRVSSSLLHLGQQTASNSVFNLVYSSLPCTLICLAEFTLLTNSQIGSIWRGAGSCSQSDVYVGPRTNFPPRAVRPRSARLGSARCFERAAPPLL